MTTDIALAQNPGFLLHHLAFALDKQSDQILMNQLGIGFSQFKILLTVQGTPRLLQRHIAEALGQTEASVSRQIRLLQHDKLLQVTVLADNRREHRISLTAKGERYMAEALDLLNAYHAPIFSLLNPRQQAALLDALNHMHAMVCRGGKPGSCQEISAPKKP